MHVTAHSAATASVQATTQSHKKRISMVFCMEHVDAAAPDSCA
jgi:hypothetical protein